MIIGLADSFSLFYQLVDSAKFSSCRLINEFQESFFSLQINFLQKRMKHFQIAGKLFYGVFSASVHEFPSNVGLESVIQK